MVCNLFLAIRKKFTIVMKAKKRILVTGASGTVGYEVLKQLQQQKENYLITAFDIKSKKTKKRLNRFKKDIDIVFGNITNKKEVEFVCKNVDVVIHLAAIIPPFADEKPDLAYQINTIGTKNIIQSLEEYSPNAFLVYSSSISVYGDRIQNPYITVNDELKPSIGDEYGMTKVYAEEIVRKSKLDWSIFRLAAIMGGHKLSKLMFHQPLNTSMEIATPEDTARAFVHAIEKRKKLAKQIFNLGGGEKCRISYENFLSKSFEIFGLGKLTINPKAFAEKNFHCGFYDDGDVLENILQFRKDTLASYFQKEEKKVSFFKKMTISILKFPIKKFLELKSEPLLALKNKDTVLMQHFYNL